MPETWEGLRALEPWGATAGRIAVLLALALLVWWITRHLLLRLVERAIRRTRFRWDDALLESRVLHRAALLAPLAVLSYGLPLVEGLPPSLVAALGRGLTAALIFVALVTAMAFLSAVNAVYERHPAAVGRPIKGYLQVAKIFLAVVAGVLAIAVLLDRDPTALVTGIGALTAILLLVFRDTILSFVASIQIAGNDLVRKGDWIEAPAFGADGDVVDIALHTIKVQNWDKTITTIPTWKLIEGSFKNWRGMQESGGRRIKRALHVDMTSVRFLDDEEIERFSRFALLADYMKSKREEIASYNRDHAVPEGQVANARRLTNLGTFRAWVEAYLRQHPDLHQEGMTFLVRQLAPGPEGLPIEIYVFTRTTAWVEYERIQADIFDHLVAMVPELGLRVFQQPTGHDLLALAAPRPASV